MKAIKLNLPVKNENLYTHYTEDKQFDYQYTIENREISNVWKSKNAPTTYILPLLNYVENDQDLLKFTPEFCNKILSIKTDNPKTIKFQQKIVSKILQGKLAIGRESFDESNKSFNLVAPSNSSVRFEEDSFGNNTKINLILPGEMRLYKIVGDEFKNPSYVIAHKMVYGHQLPRFKIIETSNINTSNLELNIDPYRRYDPSTDCIIEHYIPTSGTLLK